MPEASLSQFLRRHSRVVTLSDGTEILVRPIAPTDRELLVAGFARLSDESRWNRFLRPKSRLSETEVAYLTEIDYFDHYAWVATTTGEPVTGIGVARYVRDAEDQSVAEAAVAVADDWQRRGVGTVLLELLALSATERGVERFRAFVAPTNDKARELLQGLGARARREGSLWINEIDVPGSGSPIRGTPLYDALIAAAAGDLLLELPPAMETRRRESPNLSHDDIGKEH